MKAFNKTFDIIRLGLGSLTLHKVREEIVSPWGHDSCLLPVPDYLRLVRDFLA